MNWNKRIDIQVNESSFINWSEVSRYLSGSRDQIRSNYKGKRYKKAVDGLKRHLSVWIEEVNEL